MKVKFKYYGKKKNIELGQIKLREYLRIRKDIEKLNTSKDDTLGTMMDGTMKFDSPEIIALLS